jgi:hypothetical protein
LAASAGRVRNGEKPVVCNGLRLEPAVGRLVPGRSLTGDHVRWPSCLEGDGPLTDAQTRVEQYRRTSQLEERVQPNHRVDVDLGSERNPISARNTPRSQSSHGGANAPGHVGVRPNPIVADQAIGCWRFVCSGEDA